MSGEGMTCPCGQAIKSGRKYCSKDCMYKYRTRPSGLTYRIEKHNPGWFPKGVNSFPEHKGKTVPSNFKGHDGKFAYANIHKWVRCRKGSATVCSACGTVGRCHWANVSHEYRYDLDDWVSLCPRCHAAFDATSRGSMERVFGWKGF